jgi:hypothetical protein
MALSWIYAVFGNVPAVASLFLGMKAGAGDRAPRGASRRQPSAEKRAYDRARSRRLCRDLF